MIYAPTSALGLEFKRTSAVVLQPMRTPRTARNRMGEAGAFEGVRYGSKATVEVLLNSRPRALVGA